MTATTTQPPVITVSTTPPSVGPQCDDPMGISNGKLALDYVFVSSVYNGHYHRYGKEMLSFGNNGAWSPATNSQQEFVKVMKKIFALYTYNRSLDILKITNFTISCYE